jgi:hypothetical protein
MWEPQPLATLRASTACTEIILPLHTFPNFLITISIQELPEIIVLYRSKGIFSYHSVFVPEVHMSNKFLRLSTA